MKIVRAFLAAIAALFSKKEATQPITMSPVSDIGAVANAVGAVANVTGKIIDQKNKPSVLANLEAKQIARMEDEAERAIAKGDINALRKQVAE